jgi:hypothetical protein
MFHTSNSVAARVYVFVNAAVALLVLLGVFIGVNWNRPDRPCALSPGVRHGLSRIRPVQAGRRRALLERTWRVSGRSNIDFHNWVALDLKYIDSWSLSLDIGILLKTIPAVLHGTGAS